jgi:hypothetical protein
LFILIGPWPGVTSAAGLLSPAACFIGQLVPPERAAAC